jgi:basic amino acid/polyamine antiporter, APA family
MTVRASDLGARPTLTRAIGRWSYTAAVINSIVGSSVFAMPAVLARLVGEWSTVAVLLAGAAIAVVVLCFAEVGSRFDGTGGPYLYTREAFGPRVAFLVGWLHIWSRLLSGAAVLNVLTSYLGQLVPPVATVVGRAVTMTAAVALVTALNIRGVRQASWAVNGFTVAKLLPLLLLIGAGVAGFSREVFHTQAVPEPAWTDAILLLVFAYGGFESGVVAAGEVRDPRRDTAFALLAGLATIAGVYALIQLVVSGTVPHVRGVDTPVAAALAVRLPHGALIGSLGAVLSTYGWLTGFALTTPRILFSMAERGELPRRLAHVHARFRTPDVAIAVNSAVALLFALWSTFAGAATLAAIARLLIYALTCAALMALRRTSRIEASFVVPGGPLFALAGVSFCAWLLMTRSASQLALLGGILVTGAILRAVARWSRASA